MLVGGIQGYPDAVLVAEDVTLQETVSGQYLLSGVPRLYAAQGGQLLAELPFDPTAIDAGIDGAEVIEQAMQLWVAFRHMERV